MGLWRSRVHSVDVSADILLPLSLQWVTLRFGPRRQRSKVASAPEPVRVAPKVMESADQLDQPGPITYISPGIKISGAITAGEDLYIDGDIKGSVFVPEHHLTMGELAYINAETVAREVVVYGALQGSLCAFDRVEIKKHASVAGDIATAQILIEEGAHFKGVITADSLADAKS
jgi:cytoskeletal protein CcmA (bactofilin family)